VLLLFQNNVIVPLLRVNRLTVRTRRFHGFKVAAFGHRDVTGQDTVFRLGSNRAPRAAVRSMETILSTNPALSAQELSTQLRIR
jgi:hypothetical protein